MFRDRTIFRWDIFFLKAFDRVFCIVMLFRHIILCSTRFYGCSQWFEEKKKKNCICAWTSWWERLMSLMRLQNTNKNAYQKTSHWAFLSWMNTIKMLEYTIFCDSIDNMSHNRVLDARATKEYNHFFFFFRWSSWIVKSCIDQ